MLHLRKRNARKSSWTRKTWTPWRRCKRERWAHVSIVQKKEHALVLGLDWHFFQSASIGEGYHVMLLGETWFWTLLHKQELAEKGIEEYGRFLKTSEIFEANPWEATECSGDEWLVAGPIHPHDNSAYMRSDYWVSLHLATCCQDTSQDTSALGRSLRLHNEKSGQVGLELCFIGETLESFVWLIYCI